LEREELKATPDPTTTDPVRPVVRAVCLTMVKNEQDIIEPFLRHNSRFFDAMIVLDNGSTDRTREIALAVSRDCPGIFVTDLRSRAYDQAIVLSRAIAFVQSAFFADFVFLLDADEFLTVESAEALFATIAEVPVGTTVKMPWRTYLPDPAHGGAGVETGAKPEPTDVLKILTWRRIAEGRGASKVALRLGGAVNSRITLDQGSHKAFGANGRPVRTKRFAGLEIAHLPVRSEDQMLAKGVIGWRANLARANPGRRQAFQWQRLHDLYFRANRSVGEVNISDVALHYAQTRPFGTWETNAMFDPPPIVSERKFSDGTFASADALIAASEGQDALHPSRFSFPIRAASGTGKNDIDTAFEAEWHWVRLFLDVAPFANLYERLQPASVLDVGCGHGLYLDLARQCGAVELMGVDGMERSATALPEGAYITHDLHNPLTLGRTYDIVQCMEVVEHLRPGATGMIFDGLVAHAREVILFSMAEPGQPGHQHINMRTMAEVLELWTARGWWPDLRATLGFRGLATLSWFRRNALVLRPVRGPTAEADVAALVAIGQKPFRWYNQDHGIREGAFEEAPPPPRRAYGKRHP
jgi:glycosyltransferase involved in cell wall biosynthesis/SAM-dependent methyltransferase